ncbi:MAG: ATP-binding protein [Candidatus Dormibacteraeota bacterium]|nr:ATP-binding protein [Candidatus Dormibacteraeota bacterium]
MNLVYLEDGLLITKQGAEAWFRLPTRSSELLSDQQEVNMALQEVRRLTGLTGHECHLLIVPRRYTVEAWAEKLDGLTPRPEAGWQEYLEFQRRYLRESGLTTRQIYLGVRLKRRALTWNGLGALRLQLKRLLRSRRHQPLEEQLADLGRQRAWTSQRVNASRAGARLASAAELRWLIQRPVWRGFEGVPEPARRPARGGELLALQEGVVVNDFRWVRLQPPGRAGTTYLTSLFFSRFPDELELPGGEWLYEYELLGLPHVEASVRFQVIPPREASKDVDRVAASAQDQIDHVAEVGGQPPKALAETAQEAYELKHRVDRAREPLIYAHSQLLVAARDPEELQEHVQDLIERYADLGIELEVPTGDQLNAFRQALPGDQVRVHGFQQIMAVETLAGSLYVSSSKLGDDGCYLGTGLGNVPVGFDITQAARTRQPTLVVVVGRPGCGKTTLGKKAAWHGRLRGVSTVFVDPGQEADGLAALPGIGRVNRVRLDEGSAGMLDPFRIYRDRGDAALLAADLCRHFLPEQLARDVDHHLGPVAEKVSQAARPSLRAVVDALREREDGKARWAAENLDAVSRLPMARTCFATDQVPDLDLLNALTLLQFRNLAVPDANVKREDYDLRDRLAVGLVHALTALAGRLIDVGGDADPKAIYYIEARIIMGSRQGLALLERDVLRGRKRNTTPWIDTQNATHVSSPTLSGNLAAAFVFRLETEVEIKAACDLLGIEKEPENLARIAQLGRQEQGQEEIRYSECVHRDVDGNVGTLYVDLETEELREAFNTTPPSQTPEPEPVA